MHYPALTVLGADADLVLAVADDHHPTAAEAADDGLTIFFADAAGRDAARIAISSRWPGASVEAREVDDEDWARRSQENLPPVTVGRLTVSSAPVNLPALHRRPGLTLIIAPSTGFGTGHHATTRLCLAALQTLDLANAVVLDAGTGSGILAIAACALGAAHAVGIDDDPDAVRAALENLALNPEVAGVEMVVGDLRTTRLPAADVVTANLTGALLCRSAGLLLDAVRPGGHLIVSGVMREERHDVANAFGAAGVMWERAEEEWVGLVFRRPEKIS